MQVQSCPLGVDSDTSATIEYTIVASSPKYYYAKLSSFPLAINDIPVAQLDRASDF